MKINNIKKVIDIGVVVAAMLGILYVVYYYFSHCFTLEKSVKYNLYFLIIMALIVVPVVYITFLIYKKREYSYSKLYVVLAICWGAVMQFAMPPISGVDEALHIISVLRASNVMMGIPDGNRGTTEYDDEWIEGYSYFPIRECDSQGIVDIDLSFPKQFEFIADGEWLHTKDTELTECTRATSEWYRYVPAALGVIIGRLLHFGFYGTIFLGRFMNTLLFVLIGWFCISIMPVGKLQVILFALLPTTLNLCNSFSYDNMSIMFSLLLLALIMHYSKDEVVVHIWDLFILIGVVVILMPNKVVYSIFALWIFAIPFKKWKNILLSKKWYEYLGIAILIPAAKKVRDTIVWKYQFIAQENIFKKDASLGIEQDPTRPSYTWEYIKGHLGETIKFSWDGIKEDFWYNIKHCIGSEIGMVRLNAPINIRWTVLLLALIIASYFIAGKGKKLGKQQLIVIVIGTFGVLISIFLGCLIRFTPTEGTTHVQISYRYLMPIYMSLMMVFGNSAKENDNALYLIFAENIALLFAMTSVITYLLTR